MFGQQGTDKWENKKEVRAEAGTGSRGVLRVLEGSRFRGGNAEAGRGKEENK